MVVLKVKIRRAFSPLATAEARISTITETIRAWFMM